jgi:hypothetical protein
MPFHDSQIDPGKSLVITYATPAYSREGIYAHRANVVQYSGATEYLGRWYAILRGSQSFIKAIPCLEYDGGDSVLGE